MSLPYENSTAKDPLSELQRVLDKFGCQMFGTAKDNERGVTIVQFKWRGRNISIEASWKGYAAAWLKAHPYSYGMQRTKEEHHQRALQQAQVSVGCVLRDWVKGQVTAIECGVMSFEAAFMPHMLLPDGRRLIEAVQSSNLLPPPEEKVVQIGNGTPHSG
jgi:hypothetical protein